MAYTEEIASIRVRAVLDKTELNRSIADMSSKRYDVNVGVTSSGMNTLEKNLRGILSSTQNFLYANPLRPQVDLKNINRLEAKINELNNNYKNLEIKVRVKPDFTGIDENLIDGLVKGITANTSKIEKAGELVADKLVQSIKDKLEIRSPSRVSAKIGQNFMEGMDIGLDDKKLNAKLSTIEARFTQAKNRILSQASTGKINTDQAYNQLSRLSRDIDSQKRTIAGSSDLSLKVDDSALTNLNNKLDLTIVQLKNIQSYIDQNPIRMRVDDSEVNTEKVSKRKYVRNDTTQELKSTFNSFADDVGKTISKSINKEIKKSQSGGLFASLFSFPKAVFAGFQQGIGIAIAQQWSNGFVSVFEKRFKTSLENIGASEAANFLKFGENIGDALVKKLGIVEGLKGLEPILKNVESAFAEIVPVDLIDAKIAKVEKRIIKLLDDFSKMSSLQTNLKNVSNLSKSVGDIATIPIEGFDRRRDRIVREAAANIRKNYDPNKATPVEAGVNGVTIVSGGFAGAGGKSGGMVAQKLGILLGNQQQVIPVNNPKTDVSASNLELGMPRWLSEAGLRIAQHNIFSGINPDSVDMAKKAYDVYKQDPTKKITLGGYSAGGFVAHDAKEILKTLGVPANAFAIGTPIWGKKGDLQAGEFKSVVREMDGVAQVANKFKVVFGELSEKFTTIVPGYGHELANYLSQPESQKVILNQVYGKNAPEPGKNQRSPEAYRAVGYKADAENLMSSLEYQLTNPLKDPLVAKKFLIQTYADMKRIQGDLNTAIEELDGEMQEELKAYVNGLQEGIDLIEQTVGKPSTPASKTADAAKELENSQEKQRSEMRSLMETLNKKDIIEPIGKELGLKNVRNTNKSDLINSILNTADPSAIKKFLPHTTPPSADVIKEITARKSLATYELKNLLVNTRENITAISAKNYGKKSGRDISDVSEAIEKEYQIIISMLSSGVEKDAKALLEQQKLELGKIRAKSIREVTTQVSSEAVNRNRSGGGEVTQLASVDPRKIEELYKTVNVQHNYRQIFSEVARFSGVKFDPSKLPQLIVDDKRLEKVGANALYDIKKNKIIIHNSLKEILENSPDQLKEHAKHLSTIVHESRHALQFRYGKVSLNDISRGVNMGVTSVPPDFMSRQASFNAALSVDVAKKGSKRPLPQKLLKAIHTVESDAYGFSDLYTKRITENLVNQNIQKIPDVQQIDEPTERIGTFMDRIGENITKIQNRFKLVQHGFKILGQEIKEFLLSLPGGRLIADLIGRFRNLFSPKVGAVAQANINGSVKPPTPASTTVGNNLIGGVGSIAKETTAAVKQLLGDIKSIYKEFTKDLPPGNFLTSGIEKIGKMGDLLKAVVVGFIGFKLLSPIFDRVKQFADDSTRVAIDMQRINNQVIASAGGGSGGMAYLREIRKNSEDLRLNIKDSLEASAGFSASTVGTSIEGQLGTETFKNFQTLLAARGTTTERSKNFLLALEQSASKGVQAEELRGQMAEAVPGIISIFARSQGLDNRGFAAKMKNTPGGLDQSVLFEASQQAKAENLVNISKAFDTVDSAQNRFNNNVMKLQESIGGLSLEFEKVKFNTLSEGFELISNNIELISKGISVLLIYAGQSIIITALRAISQGWLTASASIKQYIADYLLNIRIQTAGMTPLQKAGFLANNSFDKLSSTIGGFADMAKPFVAIAIGMEAISNVANLLRIQFTDLSGDIKKYADTAKNANIEIEKSLKTGVVDENSGIGADNRWSMRVKKMMENPLRALNPFDQTNREGYKKASDTYSQGNKLLKESEKLRGIADSDDLNKKIAELAEIDKKRGEIAAKLAARSQLSPGDSPASKALRQQQESLIKDRADRVVSVGAIQSQLESRVKELKLLRDSVKSQAENGYITKDSYLRGVTAIDEELKKLESTQDRITKSIGESKNAFDIFKKSITSATVAAEDIRASIDTRSSARRTIISEQYARGNYNQADRNILNQFSDIRTAKEQRDAQARAINQQSELFRSQQATNVLSAYGVNGSTGVARVGQLANGAEGNNKYILEEYAKLQQSKQDFVKTQQQLADSNASLRDLITETSKSIKDYYTGIEREIKQTNIEINKISAGFQFTDSQNRIREALTNGADNMFTQFADGIIANIDKAKQRSDASYDSSSTILGIQNKIADSRKSYTEFNKTLPKIPIELDFSSVNSSENVNAVNDSLAETQNRLDDTSVQFNNINGDVDNVGSSLDRNNQSIYDQIESITNVLDTTGQVVQQTDLWNDGLNQVQPTTDNINESFTSITTSIESLVSQTLNWIDSLSKGEGVLGGLVASARSLFAGTTGNSLIDGAISGVKGMFGVESQQPSSGIINPVKGGVFTSPYGMRKHPITGQHAMHGGLDIGHSRGEGTPILAPISGIVTRIYESKFGGKSLELKSINDAGKEIIQSFLHLSAYTAKVGQSVRQGEEIAKMGSTGRSTAPHLHWEVKMNGSKIDPMSFLRKGGTTIPAGGGSGGSRSSGSSSPAPMMDSSPASTNINGGLLNYIKDKEKFRSKAYWDYKQYSIGYGTTAKSPNEVISEKEAESRLITRLSQAKNQVLSETGRTNFKPNQLDALTSLAFNTGSIRQFPKLLQALKSGNDTEAAKQFLDINKAGGSVLGGLTTRRREEAKMFLGRGGVGVAQNQLEGVYSRQTDVVQQQSARDQKQQDLQAERERNQNLRAFDRNIRDLKDQRRASSREVSDSHFEAGGIKSPTDQYKKRITDNDRKYDDMIRTREQKLRETNEAIQSGQSLLQTLPPEAVVERTKVTEGLKQNQDYVKQLTSEISQLRTDQKTSANNITKEFNQEEKFKDEKFNFQLAGQKIEQQRQVLEQAKKQVAITPDNTLQEEINLTEKDISLKSDQLDLETKLQDIRERLFKKEISADRAKKEAEALFSLNDEKQRTIELTFKQAEAERAQTYGQIAIDKATKTLEYQNELRAEQIKQLGILQRRNPLIDSMKNIDLERQTSTDSNINDTRKRVFEATYNKNYTEDERAGLIARENELSAIRQKNIDDEAALRRDEQAKTDIENRNSRAQALRDFTSQSEIELKRSRATKITDLGGNPIRANRLNREAGVMEETNRFKTSLEDLESKVASLRFQGIEVSEAAVTSTRENLEAIHKLNIDDLNRKYMTFGETLNSVARQGFGTLSSSLTDLILKGGSFSDVLDNFANTILSGALNAGMSSLFGGLFGGLFYDGGIVGYADGGVIGAHKKERAMSGREPRMIMAHVGELLVPADRVEELKGMGIGTHEILGYANGGVVGSAPASTIRPTRSGGKVKIETTVINKQEYASIEQVQAAMDQAQRMGAMGGFEMVQDKMTNDANFRSATGLNR